MTNEEEDDRFKEIVSELGADFASMEPQEPEDYKNLKDIELLRAFHVVKQDLLNRGVLLHPSEEEDIHKQANYYGMIEEMNRRGLR